MRLLTYDTTRRFDGLKHLPKQYELALQRIAADAHSIGYLTSIRPQLTGWLEETFLEGIIDVTLRMEEMPRECRPLVREYATYWFERGLAANAQQARGHGTGAKH